MSNINIKKILLCLLLVLIVMLQSGCWDSLDIDEKSIVVTAMMDYKDGEIILYGEKANIVRTSTTGGGSSQAPKFTLFESRGKDLNEMRTNMEYKVDKPIYTSGVRVLVMTEAFANEYLVEYLYRFRSKGDYRKKINTVITQTDPKELFAVAEKKEISVGIIIEDIIESLDRLGKSFTRTTMRLLENVNTDYTGILLPCMGIKEEEISLVSYAVLNGTKITGFMPVEDSRGTMYSKTKNPKFIYRVPYEDLNLTFEVVMKKHKVETTYVNEIPNFDVTAKCKVNLLYGDKKTPYNLLPEDYDALTIQFKELLEGEISKSILDAQNVYNCDYLQFDDAFRIHFPVEFAKIDWATVFPTATHSVDIEVELSDKWSMFYGERERK